MSKKIQMSIENCYLSFLGSNQLLDCKINFFQDKRIKIEKNSTSVIGPENSNKSNFLQNNTNFHLEINLKLRFSATINWFYMEASNAQMIQILLQDRDKSEQLRLYICRNSQNYNKIYQYLKLSCFIRGFQQYFSLDQTERLKQRGDYFITQQKTSLKNRTVKRFSKIEFSQEFQDQVFKEITLQKNVESKNIMNHYGYFEDDANYYLVYEQISLKTLRQFSIQSELINKTFTKTIMRQMLQALLQLQIRGIIHNNIRMSTIKMIHSEKDYEITFCLDDFSKAVYLSQLKKNGQMATKFYGYSAPEVININNGKISYKSDIFMLGVVFYQLLTKKMPFDLKSLYGNPGLIDYYPEIDFNSYQLNKLSFQAKQLLTKMLEFNPDKRISVIDALTHRYFTIPDALVIKETKRRNSSDQQQNLKENLKFGYKLQTNQIEELVQSKTLQVNQTLNQKQNMKNIYHSLGSTSQQNNCQLKLVQLKRKKRTLMIRRYHQGQIDPEEVDDSHINLKPKNIKIIMNKQRSKEA